MYFSIPVYILKNDTVIWTDFLNLPLLGRFIVNWRASLGNWKALLGAFFLKCRRVSRSGKPFAKEQKVL